MTAPRSTTSPGPTTRKIDLSLTQVIAAALAAVTSAVLGSRLGAAGTLIGAAGASAIVTVGTAVYRASLEHSQEKIRSLARQTRRLPPSREGSGTGRFDPAVTTAPLGGERVTGPAPSPPDHFRRFARLRWGAVAVAALGGFVLAMMVITGVEWARGETLGGNGDGTTIGRVVDAPSTPRHPVVPRAPHSSETSTSEAPSETSTPDTSTPDSSTPETTAPDGSSSAEPNPSTTPDPPAPGEVRPTPPLVPTRVPSTGSF